MAPSRRIGQLPGLAQRVVRGVSRRVDRKDWAAPHDNFGQARVIGGSRVFVAPERVALLTDPGLIRPGIRVSVLTRYYQEVDSDPINDILHIWQRGWLVEDSLARADRTSSAARIELRYPMLDTNLRHFCAQLSGPQRYAGTVLILWESGRSDKHCSNTFQASSSTAPKDPCCHRWTNGSDSEVLSLHGLKSVKSAQTFRTSSCQSP